MYERLDALYQQSRLIIEIVLGSVRRGFRDKGIDEFIP
jgi:hypothetical protein